MNPRLVLVRVLAIGLCMALAALAGEGETAGVLAFAGGATLPSAFLSGGTAFLLVLPVTLMVAEKLGTL